MSTTQEDDEWVRYDTQNHVYRTKDGTAVAGELIENVQCLAHVLHICQIRDRQRKAMTKQQETQP